MEVWEELKPIKLLYETYTRPIREKYELTQMEFNILLFLHNNKGHDTAAEIVKMRKLSKSQVSSAVKFLLERGFLECTYTEDNHKKIHLILSERSSAVITEGLAAQLHHRDAILRDFSEEEKRVFTDMFHRISENAKQELNTPVRLNIS